MSTNGDCSKCGNPIEVPWLMVKLCEPCLDAALIEADRVKGERGVRNNAARVQRLAQAKADR